ncbi:MAG: hypothetical protein M3328_08880, partial [Chloroflexota bacterium]|nr:hypothetical protein [Chloroflexota bacterium]
VVGYDAVGIIAESLTAMDRLATPLVSGTAGLSHRCRNPKSHTPVDTALTALVMLIIGVEDVDVIAQEARLFSTRMRNQGLRLIEFQFQFVTQERGNCLFDFLSFGFWSDEP